MFAESDSAELETMSIAEAFRSFFGAEEDSSPWLFEPARSLALAQDAERSVVRRVADLAEMSRGIDRIFRDNPAPLTAAGSQSQTAHGAWPFSLAQWVDLLNHRAAQVFERDIQPALWDMGFQILPVETAADQYGDWMCDHFQEHVYPLLTPLAVDPGRPFPFISSDSLNLLVQLHDGTQHEPASLMARVKIPNITPRLIRLPTDSGRVGSPVHYVWSLDLVRHHIDELFVSMPIRCEYCFRVLRTADSLGFDAAHSGPARGRAARGSVVRVDVDAAMPPWMSGWLVDHLHVISYAVARYESPAAVMSLPQLTAAVERWSVASDTSTV